MKFYKYVLQALLPAPTHLHMKRYKRVPQALLPFGLWQPATLHALRQRARLRIPDIIGC